MKTRIPSPFSLKYAGVTKGRQAIAHAADTGCSLYTWNSQTGWVVASLHTAKRMVAQADADTGGMRANADAALLLYAVRSEVVR